jgi:hypothetical protein
VGWKPDLRRILNLSSIPKVGGALTFGSAETPPGRSCPRSSGKTYGRSYYTYSSTSQLHVPVDGPIPGPGQPGPLSTRLSHESRCVFCLDQARIRLNVGLAKVSSRARMLLSAGPVTTNGAHPDASQVSWEKFGCSVTDPPPLAKLEWSPVSR